MSKKLRAFLSLSFTLSARTPFRVSAVGAVCLCSFVISTAWADKVTMPSSAASTPLVAATIPGPLATSPVAVSSNGSMASKKVSAYEQQLLDAHKALIAGSAGGVLDNAVDGYRKAIALEPQRPEAHHFLAGALFYKQDFVAAQEAISNAISRARGDTTQIALLGKSLFLSATIKEALDKNDEAKLGWIAYAEFAKLHPDQEMSKEKLVGDSPPMISKVYPATVVDRVNRLDAYGKLVTDYAKVKERVLARQKELGVTEPIKKSNP